MSLRDLDLEKVMDAADGIVRFLQVRKWKFESDRLEYSFKWYLDLYLFVMDAKVLTMPEFGKCREILRLKIIRTLQRFGYDLPNDPSNSEKYLLTREFLETVRKNENRDTL